MRTKQELDQLREQAVMLRRQGKSLRQIKMILGPMSNTTLHDALRGEPPPEWTRRPRAKDELSTQARDLRQQGMHYEEIAAALGVAKSSISLWVRDLPVPARLSYAENRKRSAEGARRYWAAERPVREARRAAVREAAAAQIGELTDRELLIAGAIAYWCEGAKSKPHRRCDRVMFINSDPALIRFFLRFLEATGTARTSLSFRIYIHENADVEAAQRFWLEVTAATADQFRAPTLKHHNPKTVRKNVGEDYHGCLRIDVRRSADLYRKIEGWADASMAVGRTTDQVQADEPLALGKYPDTATGSGPVSWNCARGNVP
jgi:transcriptional regulator with XRE-family HTH domain